MKCLFINPDFPPPFVGGTVVYYYYIHQTFRRDELVVMTAQAPGDAQFDAALQYKVVRTGCMQWTNVVVPRWRKFINLWGQFWLAYRLIRDEGINVIHIGQMYPNMFTGRLLSLLTGCPCVVTVHGEELMRIGSAGWLFRLSVLRALCRAVRVFTISRFTQMALIDQGVRPDRIVLLPGRMDPLKCDRTNICEPACAQQLKGKRMLLTVGRLTLRKGQDMVLKAMVNLTEHPNLHYVIVGQGEEEARLRQMAADLGLCGRVTLVTNASGAEVSWFYKNCEIFLTPNRTLANGDTEGFGIVFLEAGFWEKPVIGGNAGGVPDAVEDGVTGILVDGFDPAALERAIRRLLDNPDLAREMGRNGMRKSLECTWENRSVELRENLKAVVTSRIAALHEN
jgi:glycosyltransferase involved in cell wall biosynthesis